MKGDKENSIFFMFFLVEMLPRFSLSTKICAFMCLFAKSSCLTVHIRMKFLSFMSSPNSMRRNMWWGPHGPQVYGNVDFVTCTDEG